MSWGDVRGLLQYVPQFRGKVFVMIIDSPVPALAETMLDLVSLQNIGVKIIIGSTIHGSDDLLDRAAEVELKHCQVEIKLTDTAEDVGEILDRGQAAIINVPFQDPLSSELVDFAHSLSASKLILLKDGVPAQLPEGAIRAADLEAAIGDDQPAMLVAAAAACRVGIARVHILDGSDPSALLSELFSNEGAGTMIYADSYRAIRPLREEDIVELLGMIGRSVRNEYLVPRDYADIEKNISDYSVMEIDGNVVGSVALRSYSGSEVAEVACLYVKQSHEGLGYGVELVRHAEQHAREHSCNSIFALTNRAAEFFQNQLGYSELSMEEIPAERRQQLLLSGRDSRVFGKMLK